MVGARFSFRADPEVESTQDRTDLYRGLYLDARRLDGSPAIHPILPAMDPYMLSVKRTKQNRYFTSATGHEAT